MQPITLYSQLNLIGKARIGPEWLFTERARRDQPFRGLRLRALAGRHRISRHPVSISCLSRSAMTARRPREGHGFQAHVGPMRSKSRGAVTLDDRPIRASRPRSGSTT